VGTTDTLLAQRLLRALDAENVEYLVLHNGSDIAKGEPISDVDTIVRCEPWHAIRKLIDREASHGLSLVMTWEYDFGALTSFWMSADGSDGVQLDLLRDPHGRGRYGFLTERAFRYANRSEWPPRLAQSAMLEYLLSKRIAKGDIGRASRIADDLKALGPPTSFELLNSRCRRICAKAISGQLPKAGYRHYAKWRSRASLLGLRRLTRPTGIVVSVPTADGRSLHELKNRFSAVLARVAISGDRGVKQVLRRWWLTRTPALIIASCQEPVVDKLSVSALDLNDVSKIIVGAMEETTRARPQLRASW
jgi:hypothetical protein